MEEGRMEKASHGKFPRIARKTDDDEHDHDEDHHEDEWDNHAIRLRRLRTCETPQIREFNRCRFSRLCSKHLREPAQRF